VARVLDVSSTAAGTTWKVAVDNTGKGDANDVRLDSVSWHDSGHARSADPVVTDRDPKRFPVPVTERIRPGETATATVAVDASTARGAMGSGVVIGFSANGGRTRSAVRGKARGA
jgi:rhamnogalacturonan endolyase